VELRPPRKRLPKSRPSRTTSFTVGGAEGYMTSGSYPDDGLGEVFLKLGKRGSTLAGMTDDPDIRMSQSIMDYIFRRLALDYMPFEQRAGLGIYTAEERQRQLETGSYEAAPVADYLSEAESLKGTSNDGTAEGALGADAAGAASVKPAPKQAHTSAELLEAITGTAIDSPLCFTCGTKMRPAGSCFVCEGCGSTSGCS